MLSNSLKILYSVQATGNGHISRASEVYQYLSKYGTVDILLSGSNCNLPVDLPVKYRLSGISLFYKHGGGLDYWKMFKQLNPFKIIKQIVSIPVHQYDLIINDFDSLTSLACRLRKVKSVHWGHQASFQYTKSPRPEKSDTLGEWVLKNYCKASVHIGLHFLPYDLGILPPIIKESVRQTNPSNQGHLTVYLPQYSIKELINNLSSLNFVPIHIFTSQVKEPQKHQHITCYPVDKDTFSNSMIHCAGLITAGGFESPAEALYLGKKLIIIPIRGQYEQLCNSAALSKMGVPVLPELTVHTGQLICKYFSLFPHQISGNPFQNLNQGSNLVINPINPFAEPFTALEIKSKKNKKSQNTWLNKLSNQPNLEANSVNQSEIGNYFRLFSNEDIVDKMMSIAVNYVNTLEERKSIFRRLFKKRRYPNLPLISDLQIPVSQ